MQEERKYLDELFQKYRQGTVTEKEKELIARWLEQLDAAEDEPEQSRLDLAADRSRREFRAKFQPEEINQTKIVSLPLWLRSVAASILALLSITAGFYIYHNRQATTQTAYEQQSTGTGQMKTITLADGTRITLNNRSRLKYPVSFAADKREVTLSGEAFFEVNHEPTRPFIVHTDKINVQVLGTSFNIQDYPDDVDLSVAVVSGKVGVMQKNIKTAYLIAGDALAYHRLSGKTDLFKIDGRAVTAWQQGVLVFDNEQLESITRKLERFYKVSFVFKNQALKRSELSLKVKNQSLAVVMSALSISGDFHYKISKARVTIW
ncbi:FecR family protein [Mucilaginibacter gracilis]|uniref:FecR family protein n=1 Tax=Mucilaginibacter gracilis TaxID=423350 RepID=A0A495J0I9_9SPHI|nr:FecR family protein [Mucilaginibacter gracilis]RKR82141.1 FecR family protein [Mucilaginibacter gracilis]